MDGKDYSIFAVLPPYNTVRAQLIKNGSTAQLVTSGVTLSYEAVADTAGSINTSSSDKTNFWTYSSALFLTPLNLDEGLAGKVVQSKIPQPLDYNSAESVWEAVGIPTVPYDDQGVTNPYPMAKIVAKDSAGKVLAEATVVLAVSDEMSCMNCHASGSNPAAQPAGGWVNNPDLAKDVKLNILKLHDERNDVSPYLPALATKGYTYQASLMQTATSGTPILCATCHASNALSAPGVAGVPALTQSMHSYHGPVVNPGSGTTLDNATSPFGSCYLCHPGVNTRCQRGAMSSIACMSCHGNLTAVGSSLRRGWLDVPACQNCHTDSDRYTTTFDGTGAWRTTTDATFATNPNTPVPNTHLFRLSKGHGNLGCPGCHGAPHAEYPTSQPNDNVYPQAAQSYGGEIRECTLCHGTSAALTNSGGPHGIHSIGQTWVDGHHAYAENGQYTACAYCHGADYRGSPLSATPTARSLKAEETTKNFPAGYMVGCYDCHNGPTGD
ncbi:MAG: hypothetical protein ACE145_04970 [Terriglobia bacterium]